MASKGAEGAASGPFEEARVHLQVFGQERELSLQVRTGPCSVDALLGPARELSQQVAAIAIEHARAEGKEVQCKAACNACCRHLIPISSVEAAHLAAHLAAMPPTRQASIRARFAEAIARLEATGLLDPRAPKGRAALRGEGWMDVSARYFAAQIRCPFLEGDLCGVYEERPMVCREYSVTTEPSRCDALEGGAEAVERPLRMSEVMADAAAAITGVASMSIPLPLLLAWAEVHGPALEGQRDGVEMFYALLEQIDRDHDTPYGDRD